MPLLARDPVARSSHAVIDGHISARILSSPYVRYSSHGTTTTASPQPADPFN
jgi:hypothetical protein